MPTQSIGGSDSCFVAKLSRYIELDDADRLLINRFEETEESFSARHRIHTENEDDSRLYVVKSGWLYSWTLLRDGRRMVEDIHLPGDMIGMRDTAFESHTSNLSALNDCIVCPYPKSGLDEIFEASPRITAMLYTFALLQTTVFADRMRAVARMPAQARLAHFILQTLCRLRITNHNMTNRFRLPLTQELIGDCIGLSQVYVNRTMIELIDAGWIARDRDNITILAEDKLKELSGFTDRFYKLDTSWFPQGRNRK